MVKFLYQWGGGILMAVAFIIGIPDSITNFKEVVAWVKPFGMQPIHVAFWLLGIGAIYTTIIQSLHIKNLEKSRPKIKVIPTVNNKRAILEVHNIGGEAKFTAKGRVIADNQEPQLYAMYWEACREHSCPIDADGTESILVGSISDISDEKRKLFTNGLKLHKMGISGEEVFGAVSVVRTPPRNHPDAEAYTVKDKSILEVEITSTPKLRKPFKQHYSLEVTGRQLWFIPVSNPDKEGSQT